MIFISLGSNLGIREEHFNRAKKLISASNLEIIEESPIYESSAVDYLDQPDFLNQILCLVDPLNRLPEEILKILLNVEHALGRVRLINKGPRTIDIDILFIDDLRMSSKTLIIPHPELYKRSFIVQPLLQLKSSKDLVRHFQFPKEFDNSCWIYPKE